MASKIIKAFAVAGYVLDLFLVTGWRTCVRIAVLPRWAQCKWAGSGE
jgi:hypothetical protein